MEKHYSSVDKVKMIWWATVWCAILGSWPAMVRAAPLGRRQQDDSSPMSQQQQPQPSMGQNSQALIAGLAAGVAVVVLTGITLVICYPPRKWARYRSTRPIKPWIQQTTTTTVTSHSRSGSSESTDTLTERAAPLPMTRITNIDKRGRYIISKEAAAADAESDVAGPSSRRPPATLQRYSVHVTSSGSSATSSKAGGTLPPLPEESGSAARFLTSENIMPRTSVNWPIQTDSSSASTSPSTPGRSGIADRRGRPALQSIQVPSPSSPANGKGKGKARLYYR